MDLRKTCLLRSTTFQIHGLQSCQLQCSVSWKHCLCEYTGAAYQRLYRFVLHKSICSLTYVSFTMLQSRRYWSFSSPLADIASREDSRYAGLQVGLSLPTTLLKMVVKSNTRLAYLEYGLSQLVQLLVDLLMQASTSGMASLLCLISLSSRKMRISLSPQTDSSCTCSCSCLICIPL